MTKTVAAVGPLELPSLLKAYEDAPAGGRGQGTIRCPRNITRPLVPFRQPRPKTHRPLPRHAARLRRHAPKKVCGRQRIAGGTHEGARIRSRGGRLGRGHDLFFGKAACGQCHKVGTEGAKACPDLTQIGDIRTRRDLIESIAFPSATIARGYEPVTVIAGGRSYAGVLQGESTREVTLLTIGRSTTTIPRDEVEEILPSTVSIMPQGLDRNLTDAEFRDLIAYLASRKSNTVAGAAGD